MTKPVANTASTRHPAPRPCRQWRSRAGFTAIEVITVATIIAILALIIIPIVRGRVEQSKVTAAIDDMKQIETAESLADADTGFQFRLHDLRRPEATDDLTLTAGNNALQKAETVPQAVWNMPLQPTQISALVNTWKGPHLALHRSKTIDELFITFGATLFHRPGLVGGPIMRLTTADIQDSLGDGRNNETPNTVNSTYASRLEYPIDPWGNPYIFYGKGYRDPDPQVNPEDTESSYTGSAVYCLGPDLLPGTGQAFGTNGVNLYRESGFIGTGDDLKREF